MDQGFKMFRKDRTRVTSKLSGRLDIDSLDKKVEQLFTGQDLLFERLHTEPKWQKTKKFYNASVHTARKTGRYVQKQPIKVKALAVVLLSLWAGGLYQFTSSKSPASINEVAGVSTSQTSEGEGSIGSLQRETPSFELLVPAGKEYSRLDIVRVSPVGNDPVYAYIDSLENIDITVSQQQVPESFDYNKVAELERVANDFQATNVIQIDDSKIFHGLSDKTKQQSLVFIKDGLLVFIKSPEKLSDDTWANYVLGLSKN